MNPFVARPPITRPRSRVVAASLIGRPARFSRELPAFFAIVCAVLVATPVIGQAPGFLYWTGSDGEGVWRAQLDGSQVKQVAGTFQPNVWLAADTVNGRLYFAVKREGGTVEEVWSSDLDGRNQRRMVTAASFVRAVAVDPGGRFYWTDGPLIRRAQLDGSAAETLFTSTNFIVDLALDLTAAPNPRIYFIDDTGAGGRELRSIRLDGSDLQTLPNPAVPMVGLTVDEANDRLFLATQTTPDSIYRLNQDGSGLVGLGIDRPNTDLQVAGERLYFHDGSLESVDLDGQDRQTVFTAADDVRNFVVDLDASLAFVFFQQIHRINLDGSDETPLIGNISNELHDLAVTTDGTLVLASPGNNRITVIDGASGDIQGLLVSRDPTLNIRGLTLGPGQETVYWASLRGQVAGAGIDGSGLIQLPGEIRPHDIAVDAASDLVYWTANIGSSGATDTTGVIRKSDLLFQAPEDVLTGLPRQIRGLDVDDFMGQIYFTDHGTDQIRRVDVDGTHLVDIVAATTPHDVVVDEVGGWIYWTEGIADSSDPNASIRRFPLGAAGAAEDVVTGLSSYIRDLTLVYLPGEIFEDNFESGDLNAWSATSNDGLIQQK